MYCNVIHEKSNHKRIKILRKKLNPNKMFIKFMFLFQDKKVSKFIQVSVVVCNH